jgi:hypothetical protein
MADSRARGDEPPGDPFLYQVADDLFHQIGDDDDGELAGARERYEARRGLVRQDEELWEAWTQAFLEWFGFEWKGEGEAAPPAVRALEAEKDARRAAALRAWLRSQRALVQIGRQQKGRVRVRDICRGGLFDVSEQRSLHGVDTGDMAEVRLIGFEGKVRFGRTFLYHPTGTAAALEERVVQLRSQGRSTEDILDQCAALRLRTERYRHVDPVRLYRSAGEVLDGGDG